MLALRAVVLVSAGRLAPDAPLLMASLSETVRIAVMGTGGRGSSLARSFAELGGAQVVSVCDVDRERRMASRKEVGDIQDEAPEAARDVRRVLERKDLDALVIAAPDHWHVPAALLALSAGKHVYLEKPCSHSPREGELLVEAAKTHRRIVQIGTQRRSWPNLREAVRRLRTGVIGECYYAHSWYANSRGSIGRGEPADPPSGLDYELWQGPAPREPYRDNILHYNWHWFRNWGTGEAGNNGVHALDLCRWGLGVDFPERVTASGDRYHWDDDWEFPDTQVLSFEFPGGKSASWEGRSCNQLPVHGAGFGASFHGREGSLVMEGNGYAIYDMENELVERVESRPNFDIDEGHLTNFLEAIRSGTRTRAPAEEGHRSTLLCQLGNIAHRTDRALRCSPATGRIRGDEEAMQWWDRSYAQGWTPRV